MTDPTDDQLRAALRAEADGVTAGDELLQRIQAETAPASRGYRRLGPWMLAAAALVLVVAGVALVQSAVEEPTTLEAVDEPTLPETSSTDPAPAEAARVPVLKVAEDLPAGTMAAEAFADGRIVEATIPREFRPENAMVDPADLEGLVTNDTLAANQVLVDDHLGALEPFTDDEPPATIVAVREDGWLVVIDRETGEQRKLLFGGDPDAVDEVGMSHFIDAVELSPDGRWIWFSQCCEPASGMSYQLSVERPYEPNLNAAMGDPRVSPDGRFVAGGASTLLTVSRTREARVGESSSGVGASGAARVADLDVGCCVQDLAWSPDGTRITFSVGTGADGEVPQVRTAAFDGAALTLLPPDKPDNPGEFPNYMPDGMSIVQVSGDEGTTMRDRFRSVTRDASYEWILYVGTDGRASYERNMRSDGEFLDGLPPLLAADW